MSIQKNILALLFLSYNALCLADTTAPLAYVTDIPVWSMHIGSGSTSSAPYAPVGPAPSAIINLQGFLIEDESGLDFLRIQIRRVAGGPEEYWNGTAWVEEPSWNIPSINDNNWTLPNVNLEGESLFWVVFSSRDLAGNTAYGTDHGVNVLKTIIDTQDPFGEFIGIDAFKVVNPFDEDEELGIQTPIGPRSIEIEASDDSIGVKRVVTQVFHTNSSEYWNGTNWQIEPVWVEATKTSNSGNDFQLVNKVNFDRVGHYWIRMNVRDWSENIATASENQQLLLEVIEDTVKPTAFALGQFDRILMPDRTFIYRGFQISPGSFRPLTGITEDNGTGVTVVKVQIERRNPFRGGLIYFKRYKYNGEFTETYSWGRVPTWTDADLIEVDGVLRWRIPDVDFNLIGEYVIRLSAIDAAGNRSKAQENPIAFMNVR